MKTRFTLIVLLVVLILPVVADEPDLDYRVYLPAVIGGSGPPNLIPNPDFEQGQWPACENTVYCGLPEPYPHPLSGRCYAMMGGWNQDEWMTSFDIPVESYHQALYELRICWYESNPGAGDVLHVNINEAGTNRTLMQLADLDNTRPGDQWFCSYWTISFGEATIMYLSFEADQDGADPYATWYIDYTSLTRPVLDICQECVVCQIQEEPPLTFCDHGQNCAALYPRCPILPPPLFYRELGRECECE